MARPQVIRGGTVFDGLGNPGRRQDLLIEDGVVTALLPPDAAAPDDAVGPREVDMQLPVAAQDICRELRGSLEHREAPRLALKQPPFEARRPRDRPNLA